MPDESGAPRYINLAGATGQIRAATFQERSHLVVPVVALIEGVLHPANTAQPEFVSSQVIGQAPQGWNGRPVVLGHPKVGPEFVSANSPEILEKEGIGLLFNSEFKNDRLIFEAWIDKDRALGASEETKSLIAKLEAGTMTEVSVGALVSTEKKMGNHHGKQYFAEWKSIIPDHLAFLRDGDKGACSNEAGCGAPRVAMHLVTAQGFQLEGETTMPDEPVVEEPKPKSLRERLLEMMQFKINRNEEDMSDRDLRSALERALGGEPGFLGIDSVFPSESKVVYAVGSQQSVSLFSREYSFKNGEVKLATKAEEVHPVTHFEPVNAQSHGCGCAGGGAMADKAARIKTLIESGRFKETDRPWLEQIPDDRLEAIEATPPAAPVADPPAATVVAQAPAPPAITAGPTPVTAEQYISMAPPELQESLREGLRVQQARRAEVITALKATGRCDYTDTELGAMQTGSLERLLKLADVPEPPSFVGRLNTRRQEPEGVPPPPSLADAIRVARERDRAAR